MSDNLWMRHPDLPKNPAAPVTRLAYETTWGPRGWELVDTPPEHSELAEQPATEATEPGQPPAGGETATEPNDEPPAPAGDDPDTDSDAGQAKPTGRTGRKSS